MLRCKKKCTDCSAGYYTRSTGEKANEHPFRMQQKARTICCGRSTMGMWVNPIRDCISGAVYGGQVDGRRVCSAAIGILHGRVNTVIGGNERLVRIDTAKAI